jgi:hypothetical protein
MKRAALTLVTFLAVGSLGWTDGVTPVMPVRSVAPTQDLSSYLDQLQLKLDHTAQRANQPSSSGSSVTGLRGSKQEPVSKQLYWKGKTGPTPVTVDEVKMFRTAVEEAKAGQKDQAVTTLNNFVAKYPKSGLFGDAQDTLKMLASAPAPTPTPAATTTPAKS